MANQYTHHNKLIILFLRGGGGQLKFLIQFVYRSELHRESNPALLTYVHGVKGRVKVTHC